MSEPTKFEKLIAEIFHLLKAENETVTWNNNIPDPDNPKQLRQIDITITNGSQLTIIECRYHKMPQNVKWIEEILGRGQSLNANEIFAISSSGFTKGAVLKAKRFNIGLRDLVNISKNDLKLWGKSLIVENHYLVFKKLNINLILDKKNFSKGFDSNDLDSFIRKTFIIDKIVSELIEKMKESNKIYKFSLELSTNALLNGIKIKNILVEVASNLFVDKIETSSIRLFGTPYDTEEDRKVRIQDLTSENWKLVETPLLNQLSLDLSHINHPKNAYYLSSIFKNLDDQRKYSIQVQNSCSNGIFWKLLDIITLTFKSDKY